MKVKCTANTGEGLSRMTLASGESEMAKYQNKAGEIYIVYGQCLVIRDNQHAILKYLIKGTFENLPSWYPAELFEVVDSQIFFEWYYQYDLDSNIRAVWGYKELVLTESHYDDLIEPEDEAIRIFLERKKEIDEFS